MEQKWAANVLPIEYQEETKMLSQNFPKYFSIEKCLLIKEFFKRYMDNGFIFQSKYLESNSFSICLNNLHPAIKYTFEKVKEVVQNPESCQVINVLDVSVTPHPGSTFETNQYYQDSNAHEYSPYGSAHPHHNCFCF